MRALQILALFLSCGAFLNPISAQATSTGEFPNYFVIGQVEKLRKTLLSEYLKRSARAFGLEDAMESMDSWDIADQDPTLAGFFESAPSDLDEAKKTLEPTLKLFDGLKSAYADAAKNGDLPAREKIENDVVYLSKIVALQALKVKISRERDWKFKKNNVKLLLGATGLYMIGIFIDSVAHVKAPMIVGGLLFGATVLYGGIASEFRLPTKLEKLRFENFFFEKLGIKKPTKLWKLLKKGKLDDAGKSAFCGLLLTKS